MSPAQRQLCAVQLVGHLELRARQVHADDRRESHRDSGRLAKQTCALRGRGVPTDSYQLTMSLAPAIEDVLMSFTLEKDTL